MTAVTELGSTGLGWLVVGCEGQGCVSAAVIVMGDKRGTHTKCCQIPSRERFIPIDVIKKSLVEDGACQLGLEG